MLRTAGTERSTFCANALRILRKVSITPWADPERAAESMGKDLVMAAKPNPAFASSPTFNPQPIEREISGYIEACQRHETPARVRPEGHQHHCEQAGEPDTVVRDREKRDRQVLRVSYRERQRKSWSYGKKAAQREIQTTLEPQS